MFENTTTTNRENEPRKICIAQSLWLLFEIYYTEKENIYSIYKFVYYFYLDRL